MTTDPTDQLTTPKDYTADPFLCWRIKVHKLRTVVLGAEVALTNVLRVLEDDYAKINCPVTRGKIISSTEEIDAILDTIKQLNLPK